MNQSQSDADATPDAAPAAPVEVVVTRTGGVAGLTKRWLAAPAEPEASVWIDLIARCPWDSTPPAPGGVNAEGAAPGGADRFVWGIRARCGAQDAREAELPDDEMVGAWRALVDAVREWNRSAAK